MTVFNEKYAEICAIVPAILSKICKTRAKLTIGTIFAINLMAHNLRSRNGISYNAPLLMAFNILFDSFFSKRELSFR
jgi:hypothetical protein